MTGTLTDHLIETFRSDYVSATTGPFLQRIARGDVSSLEFADLLRQNHYFMSNGIRKFAGILLSRTPIRPSPVPSTVTNLLVSIISSSTTEADFILSTASKHGLDIVSKIEEEGSYRQELKSYLDHLVSRAAVGTFEEALVVLWGAQRAFLDCWKYVQSLSEKLAPNNDKNQLILAFIEHWTSQDFANLVETCRGVVNEQDIVPASALFGDCEAYANQAFKRLIWLESQFNRREE